MATLGIEDFELLLQANSVLSSKLDSAELLQAVMELATRVVKAEASSILLLDEKTNELFFNVALGKAGKQIKEIRLKVGEGLAGWVAENMKAAIVNDVQNDPRWSGKGDRKSDFKTRQVLAVPLITKGRLIGVVEGINKKDGSGFSELDRKALEAFSSQAAVAIENARLFEEVKGEKEKLSTVFAEMTDGALMIDAKGVIQLMNTAAGYFFGIQPQKAIGSVTIQDLIAPFMTVPPLEMIFEHYENTATIELKRREGKAFYLSGVINRLMNNKGEPLGYLFVVHDVTEMRKEELLKRNFLSLISHKLKTPLVTIAGYAPLLLEDSAPLSDFQKKALQTMKSQGMHLSNLVDKLLTFSLIESETLHLNLKPACIRDVIDETLALMKPYIEGHNVVFDKEEHLKNLPLVMIDHERICEVIRNIIENAIKFNDKPEKNIHIFGTRHKDWVRIGIEDNGPGIPPEEHPRIFHKFYQVEDSFTGQVEGAGLGLALTERIVEAHKGAIKVDSLLGRGSVFYFTLPVAPEEDSKS